MGIVGVHCGSQGATQQGCLWFMRGFSVHPALWIIESAESSKCIMLAMRLTGNLNVCVCSDLTGLE